MPGTENWLHGTKTRFSDWVFPPPRSAIKPELSVHTMHFLTSDHSFALGAGPYVCISRISEGAKVMDARYSTQSSEDLRQALCRRPLGQHHIFTQDKFTWVSAWVEGYAMRVVVQFEMSLGADR